MLLASHDFHAQNVFAIASRTLAAFEEASREAAVAAIRILGHDVVRSEDFPATAHSPQLACLTGLRQSDAVVVVLGERYGPVQGSGLSATHEEFREAKGSKDTLVFVQHGITPEPKQREFIDEARDWAGGRIAPSFRDADSLTTAVIRGLHELQMSRAAGTADPAEMSERARSLIPRSNAVSETSLVVAIASGPRQPVLRPAELDDPQLARDLMQAALFGSAALLDPAEGTSPKVRNGALLIEQSRAHIAVDPEGSILVIRPTHRHRGWDGGLPPSSKRTWRTTYWSRSLLRMRSRTTPQCHGPDGTQPRSERNADAGATGREP